MLYFHGNGGNLANGFVPALKQISADGTGFLAVSYRGYGGSTGSPSQSGLKLDAEAA